MTMDMSTTTGNVTPEKVKKMEDKKTVKIRIWGIVQGVGFRPFVAKLADHLGMKGEVLNIGGLVDIVVTDSEARIRDFLRLLQEQKPLPAEIVHIRVEEQQNLRTFDGFTILDSHLGDDEIAMIPADLSICPDCLRELQDGDNPRYMHPFISCMACGPRYTIIDRLPYDRENTAMIDFPMCEFCEGEYEGRTDRRYHAQTISCHHCGPMLLYERGQEEETEACAVGLIGVKDGEMIAEKVLGPLIQAVHDLEEGHIIGFKAVGGYNLVCSPFKEESVRALRRLKQREEKPFAIMFKDLEAVRAYCHVSRSEEKLLLSGAKPVVLLERRSDENLGPENRGPICESACKSSRYIGAFLPSMGAQRLLLDFCGPLIMTSANLSNMPIIKGDEEMMAFMEKEPLLTGVLYNKRDIRISLDDSVIRVIDEQPQMIRRSKGYAPVPLFLKNDLSKEAMVLSTGGQLKSSFALTKGPFAYVSQYFGDLDSREACDLYAENVTRMETLFRIKPSLVVSDLHPLYFTTVFGKEYSKTHGVPHIQVQHHHAHVASVMAEHHLEGPVLGVSFDGTGYGTDGAIWGGEFLLCQGKDFERKAHLEYVEMIGGDSSMKEGWKSALCYLHKYGQVDGAPNSLSNLPQGEKAQQLVRKALANHINTIRSSSMGRLFDGVAALTGIQAVNGYEGECAIMLENMAAEALEQKKAAYKMGFEIKGETDKKAESESPLLISAEPILRSIEEALKQGVEKECIALGFHVAVAEMILSVCQHIGRRENIDRVALTGGVFQNKILMEAALKKLRDAGFHVYYNISVGPNDGGICLGQSYLGMCYLEEDRN